MKRILLTVVVAATGIFGGMATGAQAAGHKDPPCSVNPGQAAVGQTYVVSVSGLPALSPINLVVVSAAGTTASPLGSTPDGSFALNESSPAAGTTTYEFTGPMKNNSTVVYSTCSVSVS